MIARIRQLPPAEAVRFSVRSLLGRINGRRPIPEELFEVTEEALAALPLAADEYGRLTACVRNARSYLNDGETGAALYELRLLDRRLPPGTRHPAATPIGPQPGSFIQPDHSTTAPQR